jgi:hypothetical protein
MKKFIRISFLVILAVFLLHASSSARPIDVGVKVGYLFLIGTGSFFDQLEETTENDPFFDDVSASKFNGFSIEGEIIWKVRPTFYISGTIGFFKKSIDLGFRSPSFSLTDTFSLTAIPILASIKYRWPSQGLIRPYIGGGVSIYPFTLELEAQTIGINPISATPIILTDTISASEVGFGGHVWGGIEIVFNRRISFLVEDRFTFFGETELDAFEGQTISLSGNQINGGILFKF